MKEVKFRVWDEEGKRMYYQDEPLNGSNGFINVVSIYTGYDYADEWKYYIFMQYTGLKDKNGKEIYEGDIITTDLERQYLIVEYRNGAFMLNCNDDGLEDYYDIFFGTSEDPKEVYKYGEVIGNIYENSELL